MIYLLRYAKFILPVVILLSTAVGSYKLGVKHTVASYQEELLEARKVQDNLVAELDVATQKINKRKAVDVKTIYVEKDPTGCADTAVPDRMLEAIINDQSSFD